jgi:hypothetical protein
VRQPRPAGSVESIERRVIPLLRLQLTARFVTNN